MNMRSFRPIVACAALAAAPVGVAAARADDPDAVSRRQIAALSEEERAALKERHAAFLALPDAERDRLRTLHGALADEGPAGPLNQTLDRLRTVVERFSPSERAAVESAATPAEKVAVLRRIIDGYRSIPPPPERTESGWEPREPGERSPLDWPQAGLIEEELLALLADRTSLLRLSGEDPLALPRAERLVRIVEAAATARGTLSVRPPEDWLPDSLLLDLDRRLSDRGLPGLAAWLPEDGRPRDLGARVARVQLIEILSDALRDAWTERVAGEGERRLLDHLAALPDRYAVRATGADAKAFLAENLVRSDRTLPPDLAFTDEERAAATKAFDLAKRLRDAANGGRRFGGRRGGGPRGGPGGPGGGPRDGGPGPRPPR